MAEVIRWRWGVGLANVTCLVLALGCGRQQAEPTASAAPVATAGAMPAAAAAKAQPTDLVWTMPSAWKEMPARPMRKATYQAPGAAGPAEVTVFYFGAGQGGDVEANIARWVGQFQDLPDGQARRDQLEVGGMTVTTVRVAQGTFLSGMPGGPAKPQTGYGMNAAVVETPGGAYFFKMTGPSATVDAEEARFSELLRSLKRGS